MLDSFQPSLLGPIPVRNKFIRSATSDNLADEKGRPTKSLIRLYTDLAKNGIGMISTGVVRPKASWFGKFRVLTLHDKRGVKALLSLTQSVHTYSAKISAQLTPYFSRGNSFLSPTSPLPGLSKDQPQPREATQREIREVIRIYGQLGGLVKDAGFDAVQIHAAHGYGLHQFLSSYTNRRKDEYGGTLENRFRIVLEIKAAIGAEAGNDFPVWIKLTTGDYLPGAMDINEAVSMARLAEKAGFFAIEPSCGSIIGNWKSRGPNNAGDWKEGYNLDRVVRMKKAVKIPVVALGGLRRLKMIENILHAGKADFISMSRPFLAEPDLLDRWASGDHTPSRCTLCNGCFNLFWGNRPIRCLKNKDYWDNLLQE
jgi:2,4-dienoyl-CoA reductase-like NADH-dependent reductase (Old Yellow Enzyme family)